MLYCCLDLTANNPLAIGPQSDEDGKEHSGRVSAVGDAFCGVAVIARTTARYDVYLRTDPESHREVGVIANMERKEVEAMSVGRLVRQVALGAGILAMAFFSPDVVPADEHPAEHPEHPEDKAPTAMTVDVLEQAITAYIESDSKLKGGFFLFYDDVDKKPLLLQLQKVHKDKLATLGDGVYFACTDLKASDGTIYDLDFFMQQTDEGIETTEIAVHKKSGNPRYSWKEEDGIWKKVKI